jgi:tetratricopeptide (TPR) repeat protein
MKRHLFFVCLSSFLLSYCGSKYPDGALLISEFDSTYSIDILSASKKIQSDPFNAELYYLRANTFYFQGQFPLAISDLSIAINLKGNNPLYHLRIAQSYLELDSAQHKKADEHLAKALQIKPDYAEAKYTYARLLLARQQYEQSQKYLFDLKNDAEFSSKAKLLLVISYKEQKDTIKAVSVLDEILLNDPNNLDATMQKALFLLDKNIDMSSQFVDKAISIDEFNSEALYLKGLILQRKNRFADAEIIYQRTIKIDPSHIFAHYNLAVIQSMFENYESVIDLCGKILDLDPSNYKSFSLRAFAFENKGNKKAALQDYKAALQINPEYNLAIEGLKGLQK